MKSDHPAGGARPVPVTCLALVFNEERRIRQVLDHAVRWADEVLVVDKSSTDRTREICAEYGDRVRVAVIPFSPKGHDDMVSIFRLPDHDWVYLATASEVPTRKLVLVMRELLSRASGDLDLVQVPRKMYSFGVHSPRSPWYVSHYPFLVNRSRAVIGNRVHKNFEARDERRIGRIEYAEDCCVHHFTHPDARSYLEDSFGYFQAEVDGCDDLKRLRRDSLRNIESHRQALLDGGEELFGAYCAWQIYCLGTALFAWERQRGGSVSALYQAQREGIVKTEWATPLEPGETAAAPAPGSGPGRRGKRGLLARVRGFLGKGTGA